MEIKNDYNDSEQSEKDLNAFLKELYSVIQRTKKLPKDYTFCLTYSQYIRILEDSCQMVEFEKKYKINKKRVIAKLMLEYSIVEGTQRERRKVRRHLLKHPYVTNHKQEKNFICLLTPFGNFKFRPIINRMNDYSILPNDSLTEEKRYSIYSGQNLGQCFDTSLYMGCYFGNLQVVTGFVDDLLEGYRMCHSWIELEKDNKIFVLDFCFNLCMPKQDYYSLFNAEVKSRLNHDDLKKELPLVYAAGIQVIDYLMEREKTLGMIKNHR